MVLWLWMTRDKEFNATPSQTKPHDMNDWNDQATTEDDSNSKSRFATPIKNWVDVIDTTFICET